MPLSNAEYKRQYRLKNGDRLREQARARRASTRVQEIEREAHKRWRQSPEGREKRNASNRAWRERHQEQMERIYAREIIARAEGISPAQVPDGLIDVKVLAMRLRKEMCNQRATKG